MPQRHGLLPGVLFVFTCSAQPDARELLDRVAAKYRGLDTYEFHGAATRPLPPDLVAEVPVERYWGPRQVVPESAPMPVFLAAAVRTAQVFDPAAVSRSPAATIPRPLVVVFSSTKSPPE